MSRRFVVTLVSALSLLIAAGCPGEEPAEGEGEGRGEGEGEGDPGEGEGEGDPGEGEGEGEGEGDPGTPCTGSGDCTLGQICLDGFCTDGCADDRDCPVSQHCDGTLGAHGDCVECVNDGHCTDQVCRDHECVDSCTQDSECTAQVCDEPAGVCVDCLDDVDCPVAFICEAQACVSGCRDDRDCDEAGGQVCDPSNHQCVIGCSATPEDSCPLGAHCVGIQCVLGCNGDDTRCGQDQVCATGDVCRDACSQPNDCRVGQTCVGGECVDGCQADQDCGGGDVCTGSTGTPGACVECAVDDDCGFGQSCDEANQRCRVDCFDFNGTPTCVGAICDTAANHCVGCLSETDCEASESCDPVERACRPDDTTCASCDEDRDCNSGESCGFIDAGGGMGRWERACVIDCGAGQACPSGLACGIGTDPDGVALGRFCLPESSVNENPTCGGWRSAVSSESCSFQFSCGLDSRDADGLCVEDPAGPDGQGTCTLACGADADCPPGTTCDVAEGSCRLF